LFYKAIGLWKRNYVRSIVVLCHATSFSCYITVMSMSMMAVVMMENWVTNILAEGTARFAQSFYPIFSPL
jgi:hypothetical protein